MEWKPIEREEGESLQHWLERKSAWADARPKLLREDSDFLESPVDRAMIAATINRAYQRYNGSGDVEGALIFMAGLCSLKPSAEDMAWAAEQIKALGLDRFPPPKGEPG